MNKTNLVIAESDSVNDDYISVMSFAITEGKYVDKGTTLFEYETSKAVIEFPSPFAGYVHWLIQEGSDVKIGTPILEINTEKKNTHSSPTEKIKSEIVEVVHQKSEIILESDLYADHKDIIISTFARELMIQQGISPATFKSNIITTRIVKDYIKTSSNQQHFEPQRAQMISAKDEIQKIEPSYIKGLSKSKNSEIKFLSSVNETGLVSRLHTSLKFDRSNLVKLQDFIHFTPLPTIVFEVSRLLMNYKELNHHISNENLIQPNFISIGIAFDNGKQGLKVAVIKDAEKLSLPDIELKIAELSERYESNNLTINDIEGSTFTITDLTQMNIEGFHPLVNYKNGAILGLSGDENNIHLDISFDHRVANGRIAGFFITELKRRINARNIKYKNSTQQKIFAKCDKCLRESNESEDFYFLPIIRGNNELFICNVCNDGW